MSTPAEKKTSKQKAQVTALKSDSALFSRLYIACQSRDGNLEDFLKYENQPWPPAISDSGDLRSGTKSDLLTCLENLQQERPNAVPIVEAKVMDAAALVNMMPPVAGTTFEMYAKDVFGKYIINELESVQRIDVVWDVYIKESLKMGAKAKRGPGTRKKSERQCKSTKQLEEFPQS